MSYSRGYWLSQRMHDTGLDGYACQAEAEWATAQAWRNISRATDDVAITFRHVGEAVDRMVASFQQATATFTLRSGQVFVAPLDDDWSMDAYNESGDAKGGDPRHPYIAVMRDIDAVLAEPEEHEHIHVPITYAQWGSTGGDWVVYDESHDWDETHDWGPAGSPWGRGDVVTIRTQCPPQPSESPAERALRLRRCRGTGPALPRAQEAHRPRRHT